MLPDAETQFTCKLPHCDNKIRETFNLEIIKVWFSSGFGGLSVCSVGLFIWIHGDGAHWARTMWLKLKMAKKQNQGEGLSTQWPLLQHMFNDLTPFCRIPPVSSNLRVRPSFRHHRAFENTCLSHDTQVPLVLEKESRLGTGDFCSRILGLQGDEWSSAEVIKKQQSPGGRESDHSKVKITISWKTKGQWKYL